MDSTLKPYFKPQITTISATPSDLERLTDHYQSTNIQKKLLEAFRESGAELIPGRELTPEDKIYITQVHQDVENYLKMLNEFEEHSRNAPPLNICSSHQPPNNIGEIFFHKAVARGAIVKKVHFDNKELIEFMRILIKIDKHSAQASHRVGENQYSSATLY